MRLSRIPGLVLMMAAGLATAATKETSPTLQVRGRVVEDLNSNGKPDPGEPGIAGVAVSNGREVVPTGKDGSYRLTLPADHGAIQITQPSGFAIPLNNLNLPQYYRIHHPKGSPRLRHPGIAPTPPLTNPVDFALTRTKPTTRFRALLFADTQVETPEEIRFLQRKVLGEASEAQADMIVNLGDILFDNLDLFAPYNRALARVGIPIFSVLGNHDLNLDAPNDDLSDETYTATYGPPNYSWQVGQVHFVALDTIHWNGPQAKPDYHETLDDRTLTWLANDLALVPPDRLIVLCLHAPLAKNPTTTSSSQPRIGQFDRLVEILQSRKSVLAVSGHTHLSYRTIFGSADGWNGPGTFEEMNCVTVSGSWWSGPRDLQGIPVSDQRDGVPSGTTLLDVDGTSYTLRYRAAGKSADHQMRIYPPGTHASGADRASRRVLVNLYYGWNDCRVELSLNNGPWTTMIQTPQFDPVAQATYEGPFDTGKPWVNAVRTNHIWQLDLPQDPPRGPNRYRVRATLPDGTIFHDSVILPR